MSALRELLEAVGSCVLFVALVLLAIGGGR